ncbi:hypothetical protein NL676_025535 [Syzygium grande]|nr:hypothetical protein NL676_025535 [Syzygium grande]
MGTLAKHADGTVHMTTASLMRRPVTGGSRWRGGRRPAAGAEDWSPHALSLEVSDRQRLCQTSPNPFAVVSITGFAISGRALERA